MVLKTREKLIDVARQLFARKGIENTTMNDIANASDKGRRTIYTYFKTKRDIYDAVIKHESEQMVMNLRQIALNSELSPETKLRKFMALRTEMMHTGTPRSYDTSGAPLRTFFIRDIKRIERIRLYVAAKEKDILQRILDEGVNAGRFDAAQARRLPSLLRLAAQGIDLAATLNDPVEGSGYSTLTPPRVTDMMDFVMAALTVKNINSES